MRIVKGIVIGVLILPHAGLLLVHDITQYLADAAERCISRYDNAVKRPAGWAYGMKGEVDGRH